MKFLKVILLSILFLSGCSSMKDRSIASGDKKLDTTILGIAKYKKIVRRRVHTGPRHHNRYTYKEVEKDKNRAVRIYFTEIEDEPGNYHVVLLEYVNLLKMAPKYIASNKLPRTSKIIGFLNQITKRITVYKAVPSSEDRKFELRKVRVSGNELVAPKQDDPSYLVLSDEEHANPLEGATITAAGDGEPVEVYFPVKDSKESYGFQYSLANFTYSKVKLDSTWRKNFLGGPYLGSYGDKSDKILELNSDSTGDYAHFIINEERAHLKPKKREKQLTNPKSAYIFGSYEVSEPQDGMFLFNSLEQDMPGQKYVEGKIGLFIDIFDATVALNQDVVELVLVDPDNPEDFLMYYEHPENGEGDDYKKAE